MPRNSRPPSVSNTATGSRPDSFNDRYASSAASQLLAHFTVKMQRVIHELVGEPRLLGDAARRYQVRDAVGLHVHTLDVAFVDHPLEINVRQAEGDPQLAGQSTLRQPRILLNRFEDPEVAMCFNVHDRVTAYVKTGRVRLPPNPRGRQC